MRHDHVTPSTWCLEPLPACAGTQWCDARCWKLSPVCAGTPWCGTWCTLAPCWPSCCHSSTCVCTWDTYTRQNIASCPGTASAPLPWGEPAQWQGDWASHKHLACYPIISHQTMTPAFVTRQGKEAEVLAIRDVQLLKCRAHIYIHI